jgi:hypothetical protein
MFSIKFNFRYPSKSFFPLKKTHVLIGLLNRKKTSYQLLLDCPFATHKMRNDTPNKIKWAESCLVKFKSSGELIKFNLAWSILILFLFKTIFLF